MCVCVGGGGACVYVHVFVCAWVGGCVHPYIPYWFSVGAGVGEGNPTTRVYEDDGTEAFCSLLCLVLKAVPLFDDHRNFGSHTDQGVCVCVCVCVYSCVSACVYKLVCPYTVGVCKLLCICLYICTYVSLFTTHTQGPLHVCTYCTYMKMHIRTYVHMRTNIRTSIKYYSMYVRMCT